MSNRSVLHSVCLLVYYRLAGKLSADFNSRVKRAKTFLDPVILERLKYLEADSDGSEKPVAASLLQRQRPILMILCV